MQLVQSQLPKQKGNVTPSTMSDKTLHPDLCNWLNAVATSRDKGAFTHLFNFFAPKILRIAKTKFSNEAQCKEVVQETMALIWRKAHMFDQNKGAPTTWVYTIMRNTTFDMLRKVQANKEDNLSDEIWPLAESVAVEENSFSDHLQSKHLLSVIDELPEAQQQVVKGFYFLEMTQEQLAEHLNLPLGTIKSRLRLALAKLKSQLGDDHD